MCAMYWNKELCRYESITMGGSTSSSPYGSHQFTLDEPTNYNEHDAWIEQLEPVWSWADDCIGSFVPGLYVGEWPQFNRGEWCHVIPATLTVEADGDGSFHVDEEDMAWLTLHSCDRFEFDGADGFELAPAGAVLDYRLFRMPLGEAHVSPPEVTL